MREKKFTDLGILPRWYNKCVYLKTRLFSTDVDSNYNTGDKTESPEVTETIKE